MKKIIAFVFGMLLTGVGPAAAETYYIAPANAVVPAMPDGTETKPFPSIQAALDSGKLRGGDTLLLKDGSYGSLTIKKNAVFDAPVTIASQTGRRAHFDSILLAQGTRNLVLKNLSVWPSNPDQGAAYLVRAYSTTSDITVQSLVVRSERNATGFMTWDAAKWDTREYSGIFLEGPRSVASRNRLMGIYHGVMTSGAGSQIIGNEINGFNGDGLRALGDDTLVRSNRVFNCVATDGNHDDGFQSFAGASGAVRGLTIDSNVIIEWTGSANPLRCKLQGIGLFDGFYDNITITNNLIAVSASAYHGISVYGGRTGMIANNTVVNISGQTANSPWIMVNRHKNGASSTNITVANNLTMGFSGTNSTADGVVFANNSIIGVPGAVFVDPFAFDYRPKEGGSAIDSGAVAYAPRRDMLNQRRPAGLGPDRGAYETQGGAPSASIAAAVTPEGDTTATGESAGTQSTGGTISGAKWIKIP